MVKKRKQYSSQQKMTILRKHLLDGVPVSEVCDEYGIQPSYRRFVGRQEELKQIERLLKPYPYSQEHLVTIDGVGGIGKTTLALEVAYRFTQNYEDVSSKERFDAVVWVSAKLSVLRAEGIITRHLPTRTMEDIYTAIATVLDLRNIIYDDPAKRATIIRSVLTRQRVLIIVDNLETVDDESVIEFLRELPAPTKAIVTTTRRRIDVAYPVRLMKMSREDGEVLIAQECIKKQVKLDHNQISHLYMRTGGVSPMLPNWKVETIFTCVREEYH